MTTERAEVRCCCDPGRLLGTVPVPVGWEKLGAVHFMIKPRAARLLNTGLLAGAVEIEIEEARFIVLDVGEYSYARGPYYPGLKSMNLPLEDLRQIRGWREMDDAR